MFNKAKLNFVVDVVIFITFIAVVISSVVLLTMPEGGYRGGRNPAFDQTVLNLGRSAWNDVHVWSSLAFMAGIFIHLVLHWRWIVGMVKRYAMLGATHHAQQLEPCPTVVTDKDI